MHAVVAAAFVVAYDGTGCGNAVEVRPVEEGGGEGVCGLELCLSETCCHVFGAKADIGRVEVVIVEEVEACLFVIWDCGGQKCGSCAGARENVGKKMPAAAG